MPILVHKHHLCFYIPYKDDLNPFIYGLKHEGVKQELARLISYRKPNAVGDASGNRSSNRADGTKQTRTTGVAHK